MQMWAVCMSMIGMTGKAGMGEWARRAQRLSKHAFSPVLPLHARRQGKAPLATDPSLNLCHCGCCCRMVGFQADAGKFFWWEGSGGTVIGLGLGHLACNKPWCSTRAGCVSG